MKPVHDLVILGTALALCAGAAQAAPFAYVPNEKSGTISIIDTATDTVSGEIPAGKRPRGIAISPDGKTIYVSDQPTNGVNVIDVGRGFTTQRGPRLRSEHERLRSAGPRAKAHVLGDLADRLGAARTSRTAERDRQRDGFVGHGHARHERRARRQGDPLRGRLPDRLRRDDGPRRGDADRRA